MSSASTSTASENVLIPARGRLPHLAVDDEHRSLLISAQIRGAPALVLFLTLSYTSSPSKHARSTTPRLSLPPSSRSVTDFPAPPRLLVLLLARLTSSPPPQALAPWPRTLPRSRRPCASSLDPSRPAQAAPRPARLTSLLVRPPSVPRSPSMPTCQAVPPAVAQRRHAQHQLAAPCRPQPAPQEDPRRQPRCESRFRSAFPPTASLRRGCAHKGVQAAGSRGWLQDEREEEHCAARRRRRRGAPS